MKEKVKLPEHVIRSFRGYCSLSDYLASEFDVKPNQPLTRVQLYIEQNFSKIVEAWVVGYTLDDPELEKEYEITLERLMNMSRRFGYFVQVTDTWIVIDRSGD